MALASATAEEIWRSIGLELVIFLVTLAFAWIIRYTAAKKVGNKLEKGIQNGSKVCDGGQLVPAAARGAPDWPPERRRAKHKDPSMVIDEVVDIMRQMPSTKSANTALALYTDLKDSLQDVCINDVAHISKHSAMDFYTTLVQCAIRSNKHHLLESILDDMSQQNVGRSLAFYESAMKQLAGQKRYHLALGMYDRLVSDGLEASAVTCSCLVGFAAEVGELQRAIGFFEKLAAISRPSIRAYMTVLRVHARRQDWPASLHIFHDMQMRRVIPDSLVLNTVLATGVAVDQIEGVEQLLFEAEAFEPPISDVISYNTLMKGYAQRRDTLKAKQVITRMHERRLSPNKITYNTAMDALVRSTCTHEAWDLLKGMRSAGFRPDKFTCSILVKGLGKNPQSEHIRTSLELLHELGSMGDDALFHSMPWSTLYHSVLEAAAQLSDTGMLMEVITQMRQYRIALNANAYRLLESKANAS